MYVSIWKRVLDLAIAITILPVAAAPMAVVAGLIRIRMGAPVMFRASRPGRNGELFTLYKFRTMTDAKDEGGSPLPAGERVTPLGRVLRRTSLDELPQLINVLRGEMSLVGPRPLLPEYLPRYTAEQARRHDVMPGITGLAQVSGRNAAGWEQKFERDVYYVDHASFLLDVRILFQTAIKVLRRDDISPDGDVNVPAFLGARPSLDGRVPVSSPATTTRGTETTVGSSQRI
jgi:lipopolysaccharide/colanic/teichoic acid biosynthesis glycosyltransferase